MFRTGEGVLLFVTVTWGQLLACNAGGLGVPNILPHAGQSPTVKKRLLHVPSVLPPRETLSQMSLKTHLKSSICSVSCQPSKWCHVKCELLGVAGFPVGGNLLSQECQGEKKFARRGRGLKVSTIKNSLPFFQDPDWISPLQYDRRCKLGLPRLARLWRHSCFPVHFRLGVVPFRNKSNRICVSLHFVKTKNSSQHEEAKGCQISVSNKISFLAKIH